MVFWSLPQPRSCSPPNSRRRGRPSPRSEHGRTPALIAELDVVLDSRGQAAAERLAALDAHTPWESPRARFAGSAAELIELLAGLLSPAAAGQPAPADGVRLHPAVLDTDLEELSRLVLPELRRRGVLAPTERDGTFREQLGLARRRSRYASAASPSDTPATDATATAEI